MLPGKEDSQEFLLHLGNVLRLQDDPAKMQAETCRSLAEHLEADRVVYVETDERGVATPRAQHVRGVPPVEELSGFAALNAILPDRHGEGEAVICRDIASHASLSPAQRDLFARLQVGSLVLVPLVSSGQAVSRLGVLQRRPRAWTEDEVMLVREAAGRLGAALERARAQTALRESEARFRALVTASSYIVYRMSADWKTMISLDGQGVFADTEKPNDAWLRNYIHPDDQPQVTAAIQQAIAAKSMFELEHRVRRADGTLGWTLSRAVPVLNAQGEIVEWFGAASDVTERRRGEEMLRENEERQSFLLDLGDELRAASSDAQIRTLAARKLGRHLSLAAAGFAEMQADGVTLGPGGEHSAGTVPVVPGKFTLADFGSDLAMALEAGGEVFFEDLAVQTLASPPAPGARAIAAVPLLRKGRLAAILYGIHSSPRLWKTPERKLMREVAEMAWSAVERARAEAAVAADLRDTQLLRELGTRLVSDSGIRPFAEMIAEIARKLTRADAGTVQIYDPGRQKLVLLAALGLPQDSMARFGEVDAASVTSCGAALQSGERTFVDFDDAALCDPKGDLRWHREAGYLSAQSTPLIARSGRPIGMVSTHWRERRRLDEREQRFLDLLARQAADMIEQWQAKKALQESEEKLAAELADAQRLQWISSQLLLEGGGDELYRQIVDAAVGLLKADAGSIQMVEAGTNRLRLLTGAGMDAASAEFWRIVRPDSGSSCGAALERRERVVVPDLQQWARASGKSDVEHYRRLGLRASQSTPLVARSGRLVGVISTHWKAPHEPTERELRLLDVLARQAADLIERKMSGEQLRKSEEKYRVLFDSIDEGFCLIEVMFDAAGAAHDYRFLEANPAFTKLTGLTDALGRTVRELVPGHESHWFEFYGRIATTGVPERFELPAEKLGRYFDVYAFRVGLPEQRQVAVLFDDISERKNEERRHRQEAELDACRVALNDALRPVTTPADVLAAAVRLLSEHLGAEQALYVEAGGDGRCNMLHRHHAQGGDLLKGDTQELAVSQAFMDRLRMGNALAVSGTGSDSEGQDAEGVGWSMPGAPAWAAAPLIKDDGRLLGFIAVGQSQPREWTKAEKTLLEDAAQRVLAALENVRFEHALRESEDRKAFLLALSDAIRTLASPEDIMQTAAEMLGRRLQASQVGYAETDNGESYLDVRVEWSGGSETGPKGSQAMPAQHGEDIRCYRSGEPWVVEDAQTDPRQVVREASATYIGAGVRATVNVPLVKGGRWVAMLYATSARARRWSPDEIDLVREVAERTWAALELARAQEALHASEEQLRFIVNQTTAGIAQCDISGRFTFANEKFCAITGYPAAELLGRTMQSITHADDLPRNLEMFSKLAQTGEAFDIEKRYICKGGSIVWVHNSVSALHDAEGQTRAVLAVCVDITERKRVEEALREAKEAAELANHSKDHFLAVLSHELRTPLTPVLMTVGSLEHETSLSPAIREDLAMIKRNIQLETKLIDDLLDISRITSGKLALHQGPVDLNDLVSNVCRICAPLAQERGISLQTKLDRAAGVISADSARLQQVLWNVLMNAIKFTPPQGEVQVSTAWLASGHCEVRVRDTGAGIPAEVLPHIFNAFEQGGAGVTRKFGGLGLGLAISKALVELHQGTIRAESGGAGEGATFIIELPGRAMTATAKIRLAAPPRQDKVPNLRLLVVEDHPDTARTLSILLQRAGFKVTTAANVARAIAVAESEQFDLLVSDLGLPDGTGYDVMRSVQSTLGVPGIAMSGFGMEEDVKRSREAGFAEHLVKPIDVSELVAAIRRVAARRLSPS